MKESSGVGLPILVTLLLVGLKMAGFIDWKWLWVFAPMWISALVVLAFILVGLIIYGIALLIGIVAN